MSNVHVHGAAAVSSINGQSGNVVLSRRNLLLDTNARTVVLAPSNRAITYVLADSLDVGSIYTISFDVELLDGDSTYATVFITDAHNNKGYSLYYTYKDISRIYKNCVITFEHREIEDFVPAHVLIYPYTPDIHSSVPNPSAIFSNVILTNGNVASDWSPAPEDYERRLAAIEAKLGITADPPVIDGPSMEDMDMDDMRQTGGYSSLYIVGLLPALIGGVRHG